LAAEKGSGERCTNGIQVGRRKGRRKLRVDGIRPGRLAVAVLLARQQITAQLK
jgi:hypothetical protein